MPRAAFTDVAGAPGHRVNAPTGSVASDPALREVLLAADPWPVGGARLTLPGLTIPRLFDSVSAKADRRTPQELS